MLVFYLGEIKMALDAMKLLKQRNELKKALDLANTFVEIIDLTLKLKVTELKLRQQYMIY